MYEGVMNLLIFAKNLLDSPIVQSALGGVLIILVFEAWKRLSSFTSSIFGRVNKTWKEETLEFEQLQSQYMISRGEARINYILLAIYGALNRSLQGIIYIGLGLIVNTIFPPLGVIGYVLGIIYLFRALQAIPFLVSDGKSLEWHQSRVNEIQVELDSL